MHSIEMDESPVEKANARKAIRILYGCMIIGIVAPFVIYFLVR